MRVRTTSSYTDGTNVYKETLFNGTVLDKSFNLASLKVGEENITRDIVTPRFRQRIQAGEIINNPFHNRKVSRECASIPTRVQKTTGSGTQIKIWDWGSGYFSPPYIHALTAPTYDLEIIAGTEAAGRINQNVLEGLVEIAEARKTMDLFHRRTIGLNDHLDDIIRWAKKHGSFGSGIKYFANNWLKYRYGIMPLVRSVEDALVGSGVRSSRETSRGFATDQTSRSYSDSWTSAFFSGTWTIDISLTRSVRAGVLYDINSYSNQYGFNVSDLPSAAWELVPYSFVADWFFNIGDYIRAVVPRSGIKRLASWTTSKVTHVVTEQLSATWLAPAGYTNPSGPPSGSVTVTSEFTNRVPNIRTGITSLIGGYHPIPFDKRVIDAFALVAQKFLR